MSTESSGGRPWWRWPLIGCGIGAGVILAVVVAIVVIFVLIGLAVREEKVASSLSLGESATVNGLRLTVDRYELSGDGIRAPLPGAQFLLVHLMAENVGDTPIDEYVDRSLEYRGEEVGGSFPADREHPMFDPLLRLFPGIGSEGWVLFEVPVDLDVSEVAVVLKVGVVAPKVASWRLVEPENADEP